MIYLKLSNTIRSIAFKHYVPFQGFNEEAIIKAVQKYLAVSSFEVKCALEILCAKG